MTTSFATRSTTDLLDAFASPDPTPGGGSAAALSGALGASLLAMVAGLPKTRTGAADERTALEAARAALLVARATLVQLIDRDAAAYDSVVAAFRLPKSTDVEKAARTRAIQDATLAATHVPIETIRACFAALDAGRAVARFGNLSAKSDVAVGVTTLGTAVQGALFNVEINIGGLKDPAVVDRLEAELRAMFRQAREISIELYREGGIGDLVKQAAQRAGGVDAGPPVI